MIKLFLKDVGDGLNLRINNRNECDLTVDFGGDKNLEWCYRINDSFLLTHFHLDHYNGIQYCAELYCDWNIDKFYHPIMPIFKDAKLFFMSLLSMNIRISNTTPIQSTVLSMVQRLNRKQITFIPVAKGDVFVCGKIKYEVLWPPKELNEEETLKVIKTAVDDFERAMEKDTLLQKIYKRVSQYYSNIENINLYINMEFEPIDETIENSKESAEIISVANDSLRRAANRLSVAFRQEDNILFLGDLEKREIKSVVNELVRQKNTFYDILIAAHHGTHWDKSLNSIEADICIASIGNKLRKYIEYDYKNISGKFIRTDEWGDVYIKSNNRVE